jgi:hypothetical protein
LFFIVLFYFNGKIFSNVMKKLIVFIFFAIFFSTATYSAQKGFEVMSFRPATDNGSYLSIWDSHILDAGEWFFGTTFDYSYRPLQLTTNGFRDVGVLDKVFEQHLYSSVGIIKNRLEVGIDVPIGWWLNYRDPRTVNSAPEKKMSFGDLLLNAKVRLLDIKKSKVGLSVLPFISLPTGKSDYFFGSGVLTAGANLIAEVNPFEKVFVAMNLGLLGKKNYTFRDINDASKLTGGLGVAVDATKNLNVSMDLLFKTRLSGMFKEKAETPIELLTGAKYAIANTGFVVNGALGGGLINGAGVPEYRILFGLGYDLPSCKGKIPENEKEIVIEKVNRPTANLVHFEFNSIKVKKNIETANLDALAKTLRKDKTKQLVVEGNTDNKGSKTVNDKISKQRAKAISRYLNQRGIRSSSITIKARGSENPVADNSTEEGRQANRRVEVMVQDALK